MLIFGISVKMRHNGLAITYGVPARRRLGLSN